MAEIVTVRLTKGRRDLIFRIVEGLAVDEFRLSKVDARAGADSPSTRLEALHALGGDDWRADRTWRVVDKHDRTIDVYPAFSERGGTLVGLGV